MLLDIATPRVARFVAVRNPGNEVVEFLCVSALPTRARLLGEMSGEVVGPRLREMSAVAADMFTAYLGVVQSGNRCAFFLSRLREEVSTLLRHGVVRLNSNELDVNIADMAAVERALLPRERRQALRAG